VVRQEISARESSGTPRLASDPRSARWPVVRDQVAADPAAGTRRVDRWRGRNRAGHTLMGA
jgi:hypothetical protein